MEKQQKKLEAKGINVELSQLRTEWENARNGGKGGNNLPIEEHEIDVVGDDESDNEDDNSSVNGGYIGMNCTTTDNSNGSNGRSPPPTSPFTALGNNNFSIGNNGGISPPPGMTNTPTSFPSVSPFHPHNLLKLRNNFSIDNLLAVKFHQANLIKQEAGVFASAGESLREDSPPNSPPAAHSVSALINSMQFKKEET